jgi:hypothetical protein
MNPSPAHLTLTGLSGRRERYLVEARRVYKPKIALRAAILPQRSTKMGGSGGVNVSIWPK